MIIYGGRQLQTDSNETFVLVASPDYSKWTWRPVQFVDDVRPPASHGHTFTRLDDTRAVLFGGSHGSSDIWVFTYDSKNIKGKWHKADLTGSFLFNCFRKDFLKPKNKRITKSNFSKKLDYFHDKNLIFDHSFD